MANRKLSEVATTDSLDSIFVKIGTAVRQITKAKAKTDLGITKLETDVGKNTTDIATNKTNISTINSSLEYTVYNEFMKYRKINSTMYEVLFNFKWTNVSMSATSSSGLRYYASPISTGTNFPMVFNHVEDAQISVMCPNDLMGASFHSITATNFSYWVWGGKSDARDFTVRARMILE